MIFYIKLLQITTSTNTFLINISHLNQSVLFFLISLKIMSPNFFNTKYLSATMLMLSAFVIITSLNVVSAGNFQEEVDITFGDHRAKIVNGGQLLSLSLDQASGSGFRSKNEYLLGRIDMQIKLVSGNSAGTVTAFYVINSSSIYITSFFFSLQNSN